MQLVRRLFDHRARGEDALGDPRSLVEHARRLEERLHVEGNDFCAEARQACERLLIGGGRGVVAEEKPLLRHRYAEPHAARHGCNRAE